MILKKVKNFIIDTTKFPSITIRLKIMLIKGCVDKKFITVYKEKYSIINKNIISKSHSNETQVVWK